MKPSRKRVLRTFLFLSLGLGCGSAGVPLVSDDVRPEPAPVPDAPIREEQPDVAQSDIVPDARRDALVLPEVAEKPGVRCVGADVPVDADASTVTMHGTLCLPPSVTKTVMVMIPGGTYNHTYFDFPYKPDTYSFRRAMNAAGYATFVVDRVGTGASSRPPSLQVTGGLQADALHAAITFLREGKIAETVFQRVILAGHSLGAMQSILEVTKYRDVDAVLLSSFAHEVDGPRYLVIYSNLYDADKDPAFAGKGYDDGYDTTKPGTRGESYYAPETKDAFVVEVDEATKDVVSRHETDFTQPEASTPLIDVPVMLAIGTNDFYCNPVTKNCADTKTFYDWERRYFTSTPCLHAFLLQGAGTNLALATNTALYQKDVIAWADKVVGTGADKPTYDASSCTE